MIENSIKMETKEVNIKNDNQRIEKKEPVSLFPRKRQAVRLLDFYSISRAKVATFNE